MAALPVRFRPSVSDVFFRAPLPLLRVLIKATGFIPLSSWFGGEFRKDVDKLVEVVEGGENLLLFPEGFSTEDGNLRKFKLGAAQVAVRTGKPVVPIGFTGALEMLPTDQNLRWQARMGPNRGSKLMLFKAFLKITFSMLYTFNPGTIKINVGKPIVFEKRGDPDIETLCAKTEQLHDAVASLMSQSGDS